MMNIYKSYTHTKNQKRVRFIYKRPLFTKEKDKHLSYFVHECSRYMKSIFGENDVYYLENTKRIGKFKVWFMNLFLPITNKIILIPTMGEKNTHIKDEYEYFIGNNEDWWSIAKKELGNGSKQYELARYNNQSIRHKLEYGEIIKIPFRLVNID